MPEESPAHPDQIHANHRRRLAACWLQAQPSVSAYVWSMISNEQDAEDVIQKVAEDAATNFDRYDAARSFTAWALGIARFKVIDYYRSRKSDRHVFLGEIIDGLTEAYIGIEPEMSDRRDALRVCVKGLSGKARGILSQRYDKDLSPKEIAAEMGSSPGYVRVALFRIRNVLHKCIDNALRKEARDSRD